MKKILLGILLISILFFVVACAPTATVTPIKGKQHNVDVQAGITKNQADMTEQFNDAAKKRCNGKFKLINQKFVTNADGTDHLIGVIKCK
jgi:hypothetical protein